MRSDHQSHDQKSTTLFSRIGFMLLVVLVVAAMLRFILVGTSPTVLKENQELVFDDFGFSVTSIELVSEYRNGAGVVEIPKGKFVRIAVRVSNETESVDFEITDSLFVVIDDIGRHSPMSDRPRDSSVILSGGASVERDLVFDVSEASSSLKLRISFGGRVGEFADWMVLGDRYIEIEIPENTPEP